MLIWSREHHRAREKGGSHDIEADDSTSTFPLSNGLFVAIFAISMSVLAFSPINLSNVLPARFVSPHARHEISLACFVEGGAAVMEKDYGKQGNLCSQLFYANSKCVDKREKNLSIIAADDNATNNGYVISSATTPNPQINEDPNNEPVGEEDLRTSIGGTGSFHSDAQAGPNLHKKVNRSSHHAKSLGTEVEENSKKPNNKGEFNSLSFKDNYKYNEKNKTYKYTSYLGACYNYAEKKSTKMSGTPNKPKDCSFGKNAPSCFTNGPLKHIAADVTFSVSTKKTNVLGPQQSRTNVKTAYKKVCAKTVLKFLLLRWCLEVRIGRMAWIAATLR